MGTKLSGAQLGKLDSLEQAKRKWDRVRKLVEQAAGSGRDEGDLMRQCHRTSNEVGRSLANNGFGALSSYALELAILIKRPGTFKSKLGGLRDAVAKGYTGFDRAKRDIEQS